MVADTQIKHLASLWRQTRRGERISIVKNIDYTLLDETSPDKQVFLNGGAPDGAGLTIPTAQVAVQEGEYLVYRAKSRHGASAQLDSDFATGTSGKLLLGIMVKDNATGAVYPSFLTQADKSTDLFADDPTIADAKEQDVYAFKVPLGETWQPYGLFQADLRTLT